MDNENVADVLEAAADALFVHGRATGQGLKDDGSMCVRGAIQYARGVDPSVAHHIIGIGNLPVVAALESYLFEQGATAGVDARMAAVPYIPGRICSWLWSDGTRDDGLVIDTLRRCAKEHRP